MVKLLEIFLKQVMFTMQRELKITSKVRKQLATFEQSKHKEHIS